MNKIRKYFNSSDLINKLKFYCDNNLNVLLIGKQGIGKTEIIKKVFNEKYGSMNSSWLYFSGATMDPFVDFIGVPKEKKNKNGDSFLDFVRPHYMNDGIEAIFIDEFNRSVRKIRNSVMELIQFKSLNGKKFPRLKIVWAAINPLNKNNDDDDNNDDFFQVEPLDSAQQDRFQVQIDLPYAPDNNYFEKKYGVEIAESSLEWWFSLPEKIKDKISPRRLDYALHINNIGGDLNDVIPLESNPSKLLVLIETGSIEKIVSKLFNEKNINKAKEFLEKENNYQAVSELILSEDYYRFFSPLVNEERKIAAFFSNSKFKKIVLNNAIMFSDLLEIIAKNSLCNEEMLKEISDTLKKIRGLSINNFNNNSQQNSSKPTPIISTTYLPNSTSIPKLNSSIVTWNELNNDTSNDSDDKNSTLF